MSMLHLGVNAQFRWAVAASCKPQPWPLHLAARCSRRQSTGILTSPWGLPRGDLGYAQPLLNLRWREETSELQTVQQGARGLRQGVLNPCLYSGRLTELLCMCLWSWGMQLLWSHVKWQSQANPSATNATDLWCWYVFSRAYRAV